MQRRPRVPEMERPMTAVGLAAAAQQPPTFLATLPTGELVITHCETHTLLVLTVGGELRNVVDPGGSLLAFPMGVACDGSALFVVDGYGDCVHRFSLPALQPEASSRGGGAMHYPHGCCLHRPSRSDRQPLLYVADWGHHRIVALDAATLTEVFSFGGKGCAVGQFRYPRGVTSLAPSDLLVVSDTDNHRLSIHDGSSGDALRIVGGVEQPYSAVGAPNGGAAPDTLFVATMGGRLCLVRIEAGAGSGSGAGTPTTEMAMPTGGRLL